MTEPKRCWILCSNRWNSAITEYALQAARALQLEGWQCYFTALIGSPGEQRARDYDLPGLALPHFGLTQYFIIKQEAERLNPQVLILCGGPETLLSIFLLKRQKLRFFGQDSDVHRPLYAWSLQLKLLGCSGVLTPAHVVQKRFLPLLQKPSVAVPLGIDTLSFYCHPSGGNKFRPTLRVVGRLDPIKGHADFLLLFKALVQNWPAGRPRPWLEIIGQPANITATELRKMAQTAGLKEGESWQLIDTRVDDMRQRMNATDLGIVCSLGSEVIGRVAEEFLLCGCPIFVSGVGSLEECLPDPSFGLSYKGLDPVVQVTLLADALWQSFQESHDLRLQRASKAKNYFSLQSMGHNLSDFISSCAQGPSPKVE